MRFRLLISTLCLTVCGLSLPAMAIHPHRTKQEVTITSQGLPWQTFSSTTGRYLVDFPGTPIEQTGSSTLLGYDLHWHMNSVTLPAVDETDVFEYYMVAHIDLPRGLPYKFSQQEIKDRSWLA